MFGSSYFIFILVIEVLIAFYIYIYSMPLPTTISLLEFSSLFLLYETSPETTWLIGVRPSTVSPQNNWLAISENSFKIIRTAYNYRRTGQTSWWSGPGRSDGPIGQSENRSDRAATLLYLPVVSGNIIFPPFYSQYKGTQVLKTSNAEARTSIVCMYW